jgi:hypothetical protein
LMALDEARKSAWVIGNEDLRDKLGIAWLHGMRLLKLPCLVSSCVRISMR